MGVRDSGFMDVTKSQNTKFEKFHSDYNDLSPIAFQAAIASDGLREVTWNIQ